MKFVLFKPKNHKQQAGCGAIFFGVLVLLIAAWGLLVAFADPPNVGWGTVWISILAVVGAIALVGYGLVRIGIYLLSSSK